WGPLVIAAPLAGSLLAPLRCAEPCQSRSRATWPPSRYSDLSQAAFAPSARSRCLHALGEGPLNVASHRWTWPPRWFPLDDMADSRNRAVQVVLRGAGSCGQAASDFCTWGIMAERIDPLACMHAMPVGLPDFDLEPLSYLQITTGCGRPRGSSFHGAIAY